MLHSSFEFYLLLNLNLLDCPVGHQNSKDNEEDKYAPVLGTAPLNVKDRVSARRPSQNSGHVRDPNNEEGP